MLLMHKNNVVAEVSVVGATLSSVRGVYNQERMPYGVYSEFPNLCDINLSRWQKDRCIPYNRENIGEIVSLIGCGTNEAALLAGFVSLTDCYWIKDEKSNLTWEDVNFYKKPFTNTFVESFLFSKTQVSDIRTPDFTTGGVLPKVWLGIDGVPVLVKFGGVKAANEVVASRLAKLMGVNHTEYNTFSLNNNVACVSTCFVKDDNTDFISFLQLKKEKKCGGIHLYHELCGMGFKEDVDKMISFIDFIHNTDCHDGNAGFFRNAETLEITGFAPLYDSGTSFGADKAVDMQPFLHGRKEQRALSSASLLLPERFITEAIITEVYELFDLDNNCLKNALADVATTYEEYEHELYSLQER